MNVLTLSSFDLAAAIHARELPEAARGWRGFGLGHRLRSALGPEPKGPCLVAAINPLHEPCPEVRETGSVLVGGAVVLRSGWNPPGGEDLPPWMGQGPRVFAAFCDGLVPILAREGAEAWIWPNHAHVLSDAPSVQTFLRAREGQGFGLLLDPVSMLAPTMLDHAEDHLARIFEALGSHRLTRGVLLANLEPSPGDATGTRLAPLHAGRLRPRLIAELWRRFVPSHVPVVLVDEGVPGQIGLLEDARG